MAHWRLVVEGDGQNVKFNIDPEQPVTTGEVGRALSILGGRLQERGGEVVLPRPVAIARDYPATHFHPAEGIYLCAVCEDAFGEVLPPGLVKTATQVPVPCTFHLDPSKAPGDIAAASVAKQIAADAARAAAEGAATPNPARSANPEN